MSGVRGMKCEAMRRRLETALMHVGLADQELEKGLRKMDPVDERADMVFYVEEAEIGKVATKKAIEFINKTAVACRNED